MASQTVCQMVHSMAARSADSMALQRDYATVALKACCLKVS